MKKDFLNVSTDAFTQNVCTNRGWGVSDGVVTLVSMPQVSLAFVIHVLSYPHFPSTLPLPIIPHFLSLFSSDNLSSPTIIYMLGNNIFSC